MRVQLWIGACATAVSLAAANVAPSQAPAPAAQEPPQLADLAAVEALVRHLDACANRADVTAWLACFEPDHPGAHAVLGRQLTRVLARASGPQRHSTIVAPLRLVGGHTIARIRQSTSWRGLPADAPNQPLVEDLVLALRPAGGPGENGRVVPTFAVEVPVQTACVRGDRFRCPPCNYEIGGASGWLCVPQRSDRAEALEAATFYLLGTDLACDVSVQIEPAAVAATEAATRLAKAWRTIDGTARVGAPMPWLPPAHRTTPPAGLQGSTLTLDFASNERAVVHVVTFGALQHVLLVRGRATTIERHRRNLDELFASYELLEVDCDLAAAAARPLLHHTGGRLVDGAYTNDRHGVTMPGPAGWSAQLRSGGAAFRVLWHSGAGSRLWLTGYAVPPGLTRWCPTTADRWLTRLCEERSLAPSSATPSSATPSSSRPNGDDEPWQVLPDCGAKTRTVRLTPDGEPDPSAPRHRWLRLVLYDDLLLVLDGYATCAEDEAALTASLGTLRRS